MRGGAEGVRCAAIGGWACAGSKALFQPTFIGQPETEVGIQMEAAAFVEAMVDEQRICSIGDVPSILPYPLNTMKGYDVANENGRIASTTAVMIVDIANVVMDYFVTLR